MKSRAERERSRRRVTPGAAVTAACAVLVLAVAAGWFIWRDSDADDAHAATAERWRAVPADPEQRGANRAHVVREIRAGRALRRATRATVLSVLGRPYSHDSDQLVYSTGPHRVTEAGSTLNCGTNLILTFRNDRLASSDTRSFCVPTE